MPVQEYICQDCQHHFDYLVRNTRQLPPHVACPRCQSINTHRSADDVNAAPGSDGAGPVQPTPPVDRFSIKTLGRDLGKKR